MNRMSAAAKLLFLFSLTSLIFLFSCKQPGNPAGDGAGTVSPRELYSEMLGTWINDKDPEDVIVLDETGCDFVKDAGFRGKTEIKELTTFGNGFGKGQDSLKNVVKSKKEFSKFRSSDACFYYYASNNYDNYDEYFMALKLEDSKLLVLYYEHIAFGTDSNEDYLFLTYSREDSGSGGGGGPDITEGELTGSYTISEANSSQFTFGDSGTWTYNYNGRTNEGTWSLDGGKVTIEYSNGGITAKAVFAVSVSGDTYTLKGESGDYATVISSVFMVTDGSAVSDGVVTLVKN